MSTKETIIISAICDTLKNDIEQGELSPIPSSTPVYKEDSSEERKRPCVAVSVEEVDYETHPRLANMDVTISLLTQRDDTSPESADAMMAALQRWLGEYDNLNRFVIAVEIAGYRLFHFSKKIETAEEDEKRAWEKSVTYRTVIMS